MSLWKPPAEPWFEVRRSEIQGRGAFAVRQIRKGTRIIEYTGERIDQDEADRRYDDASMKRHHTFLFSLDDGTVVDGAVGGNESRLINHSCDPNCQAVIDDGHIYIEALRTIREGEELVYDYAYERTDAHTEEDERLYACRCGSPKCRGSILAPPKPKTGTRKRAKSGAKKKRSKQSKRATGPAGRNGRTANAGTRGGKTGTKTRTKARGGTKTRAGSKKKGTTARRR